LCDHTLEKYGVQENTLETCKDPNNGFLLQKKRLAENMFDIAELVSCVLAGSKIVLLLNPRPN